jgi:hypothetical protein
MFIKLMLIVSDAYMALLLTSCAYRLKPIALQPPYQLRILAESPQAYTIHLQAPRPIDYIIPPDGRLTLQVPPTRGACDVYLLGIRVSRGADGFDAKTVNLIAAGVTARVLSFKQMFKLPLDADGYHLLTVGKAR